MVLSFVPSMVPMVFLRAMSGFFMASLRPVCNGLVAEARNRRGGAGGFIMLFWGGWLGARVHKQDRLLHILNDLTKDSRSIQVHATKNTMPPIRSWTADAFIFSWSLIFCGMWCISWSKGGQICLSTLVIAVGPGERLVDHSYKP